MVKPCLSRIIHSHQSTEDLLFRANDELAVGDADEARRLYTEVLYEVCPGHVCAFMNRSLAYIKLGYPELAVVDNYRALLLLRDINDGEFTTFTASASRNVMKYLRAESLHQKSGEPWTVYPDHYIGSGWLENEFASVLIAPNILETHYNVKGMPWDGLEVRAIYRMVGALWMCGGGAIYEALSIISDTVAVNTKGLALYPHFNIHEKATFNTLGDTIMKEFEESLSIDAVSTKALRKMKLTYVNRVIYPWDNTALDMQIFKDAQDLETFVHHAANACTARTLPLMAEDSGAEIRLLAARDIFSHELVLSEESLLQVTTTDSVGTGIFYCSSCAAMMITSEDVRRNRLSELSKQVSSSRSDHTGDTDVNKSTMEYEPPDVSSPPTPGCTSPSSDPDFLPCKACFKATFCSADCLISAADFHIPACCSTAESDIREGHPLIGYTPEDLAAIHGDNSLHPKARSLYELLLIRIYSMAQEKATSPLDLPEIRWLNGNLQVPPVPKHGDNVRDVDPPLYPSSPTSVHPLQHAKNLPWTFFHNVVAPIHLLKSIGINDYLHLELTDGWVLNTLYAKIMHSTRITKEFRHAKTYDDVGTVIDKEARAPTIVGAGQENWVGTIHTIFSMVGVADESKGEIPNVFVKEGTLLKCIASNEPDNDAAIVDEVSSSDSEAKGTQKEIVGSTPCIKANEFILRPKGSDALAVLNQGEADGCLNPWLENVRDESLEVGDSQGNRNLGDRDAQGDSDIGKLETGSEDNKTTTIIDC